MSWHRVGTGGGGSGRIAPTGRRRKLLKLAEGMGFEPTIRG